MYNPLSGNSHLLDVVAGELLLAIISGPTSTEDLYRRIETFLEIQDGELIGPTVNDLLIELDELGLIQRAERFGTPDD